MTLEQAEAIVKAGKECGYEIDLYERYSGRCMCGETTPGVVGDRDEIVECCVYAKVPIESLKWDNMALDMIAY